MAILTYRSVKESALTYDEMDDNFRYFKENPELNSIKLSVKTNLDNIALLPVGSVTGGLNWNINDDVEEPDTDFRLFVKTTDTLWDPIVTQATVVEVNTATADIKGIVKVGPSLTIDSEGLLEVDKFTDVSIATTNGEIKYLQTDGTELSWTTVDALPSQSNETGKFLTTNGTDASWDTVDALPSRVSKQGKILHVNSSSLAEWTDTLNRYTKLAFNPSFTDETTQIATTAMVNGRITTSINGLATNNKNSNIGNFLRVANTIDSNGNYEHEWSNALPFNVRITTQPAANDNSDKVATTGFVTTAIANLIDSAPGALNTLNELAAALGDDANFATTTAIAIGNKADTGHTHSTYALTAHTHNTYALMQHTHNYALTTHTHNYALTTHTHNTYVPLSGNSTISGTLTATDFIIPSDRTLKTNIKPLDVDTINLLREIDAVTFTNLSGEDDIGFIAQDFNKHIPVLTTTTEDELLSLKYSKITAILWKQNQELLRRIEALENK